MQPSKPRSSRATLRRTALFALAALIALLIASATAVAKNTTPIGGGHTPVTVCHNGKPLTFDDDGYKAHINHGDTRGACPKPAPVVDACPGALNPGVQAAGTICKVATVTDKCPDVLNPGIQGADAVCVVGGGTDACPDETLNPGIQVAGTVCNVSGTPGSADTGGTAGAGGDGPTGVDLSGPAVEQDHEPSLGSGAAPNTPSDTTVVSGAEAGPATAPAATDAGGDYAVVSTGGSLPVTGAPAWVISIVGFAALVLGSLAYRDARRVSRTREVGAAA